MSTLNRARASTPNRIQISCIFIAVLVPLTGCSAGLASTGASNTRGAKTPAKHIASPLPTPTPTIRPNGEVLGGNLMDFPPKDVYTSWTQTLGNTRVMISPNTTDSSPNGTDNWPEIVSQDVTDRVYSLWADYLAVPGFPEINGPVPSTSDLLEQARVFFPPDAILISETSSEGFVEQVYRSKMLANAFTAGSFYSEPVPSVDPLNPDAPPQIPATPLPPGTFDLIAYHSSSGPFSASWLLAIGRSLDYLKSIPNLRN